MKNKTYELGGVYKVVGYDDLFYKILIITETGSLSYILSDDLNNLITYDFKLYGPNVVNPLLTKLQIELLRIKNPSLIPFLELPVRQKP